MSGVGKGVATSSMGLLLQERGYKVNLVKIDPYLNVDAGTMNPTEHGEVFVLRSGLETDQDMGNYERFLNRDLGPEDYMTSGMVYQSVINRVRATKFNPTGKRRRHANLQKKTYFVPELNQKITLTVSTKGIKTIAKKGIYQALKDAALV
jgi:ribosomal protein L28